MKKISMGIILLVILVTIVACSSNKEEDVGVDTTNPLSTEKDLDAEQQETTDTPVLTTVNMIEQGNPKKINLADIAEINNDVVNAWIKLSTQFDPTQSMYNYDSLAKDTMAIAVTFSVSDFDIGETTLYWCYQLKSGDKETSVWDKSSPTDTLTIKEDGTYQMVFDAQKALEGTLDEIESLQIVFPCKSETTGTNINVKKLQCITSADELQYFSTKAVIDIAK